MDIPSITAALSGIKTATDIAKLIRESSTTLEKAELNLKLADLIGSLADAKVQVADIKHDLLEREELIRELRQAMELRETLQYEQPYYWRAIGDARDGPFCQKCYDTDGKMIRLQGDPQCRGWWHCQTCQNVVHDKHYAPARLDGYVSGF